jgi:hypothetical protein
MRRQQAGKIRIDDDQHGPGKNRLVGIDAGNGIASNFLHHVLVDAYVAHVERCRIGSEERCGSRMNLLMGLACPSRSARRPTNLDAGGRGSS